MSGCSIEPENENNNDELFFVLLKNFGTRVNTNSRGLNTEFVSLYTNDIDVEVKLVEFITSTNETILSSHVSEQGYNYGKFIHAGYDNESFDTINIQRINLKTDQGDFYLDVDIESMITIDNNVSEDLIELNRYSLIFLDFTFEDNFKLDIGIDLLKDEIILKDVQLYNQNDYPSNIEVEEIYINGVQFVGNTTQFKYNSGELIMKISLSDYYIGNYVFEITYSYEGVEYTTYTSAISINLSVDETNILNSDFKNRVDEYLNGEYNYEFNKKD
jgi:hypothetical protein